MTVGWITVVLGVAFLALFASLSGSEGSFAVLIVGLALIVFGIIRLVMLARRRRT